MEHVFHVDFNDGEGPEPHRVVGNMSRKEARQYLEQLYKDLDLDAEIRSSTSGLEQFN